MFSFIKRIFYDTPKMVITTIWKNRHNSAGTYSDEVRERDKRFIERQIYSLADEIETLDTLLEQFSIPALTEYDRQKGYIEDDELKYIDRISRIAVIETSAAVNSDVLVNLSRLEKNVPYHLMKEYFDLYRTYQDRLIAMHEKQEDSNPD
jgi:hypothetical protein